MFMGFIWDLNGISGIYIVFIWDLYGIMWNNMDLYSVMMVWNDFFWIHGLMPLFMNWRIIGLWFWNNLYIYIYIIYIYIYNIHMDF